jgi:2',3'-cyclic-nucleotide 2'-phosphodiesterase (5'-nucleotidase family)
MGKDAADDLPFLEGASFRDLVGTARHTVRMLRDSAKADIVLCLSHTGTSETQNLENDIDLARNVPGIDVIISSHTHRRLQKPLMEGRTIICSAGAFGSHLGVLDVQVAPPARPFLEHYELMPVDSTLPEDTAIAGAIKAFGSLVDSTLSARYGLTQNQVIAESGFDFEPLEYAYAHPGETGLGDLVADAYRYAATKAGPAGDPPIDAVIVPIGMIRGSFLRGPLTVADVFQVLSLGLGPDKQPGYPLITFHATGKDLLNTLEIETTLAAFKEDAHLQIGGVRFRYNPYRLPLNRVTEAEVIDSTGNLHPVVDDQLYRVCICLYSGIMLSEISSLSHGLITIQPRRRDGTMIADWKETFIDGDGIQPGTQELKAWVALLHYLQSFSSPQHPGMPNIPVRYSTPAGRFGAESSLNPIDLVKNPNRFTAIAAVLALAFLSGALWIIRWVLGQRRGGAARQA